LNYGFPIEQRANVEAGTESRGLAVKAKFPPALSVKKRIKGSRLQEKSQEEFREL